MALFVQAMLCKVAENTLNGMYKGKLKKITDIISTTNKNFPKTSTTEWSNSDFLTNFDHSKFDSIVINWSYLKKSGDNNTTCVLYLFDKENTTTTTDAFFTSGSVNSSGDNTPVSITLSNTSNKDAFNNNVIYWRVTTTGGSYNTTYTLTAYGFKMIGYKLAYIPSIKVYENKNIGQKLTGYLYGVLPDGTRWNGNQ